MSKLWTIPDANLYSALTVAKDLEYLASQYGFEYVPFSAGAFPVECDSSSGLFIVEAALLNQANQTPGSIKELFPNCRLIVLGADTVWYLRGNGATSYEVFPRGVDLWLDTMRESVEHISELGVPAHIWNWTTSEYLLEELTHAHQSQQNFVKVRDYICLMRVEDYLLYRVQLCEALRRDKTLLTGGVGYEIESLYEAYSTSKFCLGTTSPSWFGTVRTMKGFRDWIAPLCGTPLIYDDHPDVIERLPVPVYDYNDFDSILYLSSEIERHYTDIVKNQCDWVRDNTIAKQLSRVLEKYSLLPTKPACSRLHFFSEFQ